MTSPIRHLTQLRQSTHSHLRPRTFAMLLLVLIAGCQGPADDSESAEMNQDNTQTPEQADKDTATPDAEAFGPAPEGKVLRHAVFFSFRNESTSEDIQRITDAFAALPEQIEDIIDFSWGVNNSPENLNDGFTHCFLLTFKDEAGRANYLPHPAHKAFGDVLRGHNEKVFVIDYWGNDERPIENPLRHAVFFRFKDSATEDQIANVENAFAALPGEIDAIKQFEWGRNNSPERHAQGFTHCFMVTFDSEEGRDAYLPHPAHQAFVDVLKPVLDAPRVLDFWDQSHVPTESGK